MREGAQHELPFVVGGEVSQELTGEGICPQAGGEERGNAGKHARREVEQQALDRAQA